MFKLDINRKLTVQSITQVTDYVNFNLFQMNVTYDYDLLSIINEISEYNHPKHRALNDQRVSAAIFREAVGIPGRIDFNSFGCTAFKMVDESGIVRMGEKDSLKGNADVPNIAESHVQGMARYGKTYYFAHNIKEYSKGHMVVCCNGEYKDVSIDPEHYNHPGGIQRMEDYLMVGSETSNHEKSKIYLYNVSNASDEKPVVPVRVSKFEIDRQYVGCVAAGICRLKDSSILIGALDFHGSDSGVKGCAIDFYVTKENDWKTKEIILSTPKFTVFKELSDCQNISLYYDGIVDKLYLLAFVSSSTAGSYKDCVEIYEIKIGKNASNDMILVNKLHMTTKHGGIVGIDGVHFRWGASLDMGMDADAPQPMIVVCSRNFVAKKNTVND